MNNIVKVGNSVHSGVRDMEHCLFDDEDDGQHNGVDCVELIDMFVTLNSFSLEQNDSNGYTRCSSQFHASLSSRNQKIKCQSTKIMVP